MTPRYFESVEDLLPLYSLPFTVYIRSRNDKLCRWELLLHQCRQLSKENAFHQGSEKARLD